MLWLPVSGILVPVLSWQQKRRGAVAPNYLGATINPSSAGNHITELAFDVNMYSGTGAYGTGWTVEARAPGGTWTTVTSYTGALQADKTKIRLTNTGTFTPFSSPHEYRLSYNSAVGNLVSESGSVPLATFSQVATVTNNATIDLVSNWGSYYPLSNETDVVGGQTLTNTGSVSFISGKVGNCAQLDETPKRLTHTDVSNHQVGADTDWTTLIWVRCQEAGEIDDFFGRWTTTGNKREWALGKQASGDLARLRYSTDGTAAGSSTITGAALSVGTWSLLLARRRASDNTLEFIQDNASKGTATPASIFQSDGSLEIGCASGQPIADTDEAGIMKRRMTDAECTAIYNSGNGGTFPFIPT